MLRKSITVINLKAAEAKYRPTHLPMLLKSKSILFLTVIFCGIIVSPFFISLPTLNLPTVDPNRPDFELKTVEMTMYNDSSVEWRLKADTAALFKNGVDTRIQNISASLLNNENQEAVKFNSPIATLKSNHQFFEFQEVSGEYQLSSPKLIFNSPVVFWNNHQSVLYGSQKISLMNNRLKMSANSFSLNLDNNVLQLTDKVTVIIEAPDV